MLNSLYGDGDAAGERASTRDSTQYSSFWATKTFERRVKNRRELNTNFFVYVFFWGVQNLCCCCRNRCLRFRWIYEGTGRYEKFNLALARLSKEHDIQHLIEMNRIARLLHKSVFLTRQQLAIKFSHKYVISNKDTRVAKAVSKKPKVAQADKTVEKVLNGFDPARNDQDRRILFEVTGMRLDKDDF